MGDNIIQNDYDSNFSFIPQTRNISVVPQQSFRPSTLSINQQRANNPSLFTPNDYNKLLLSTPEIDDRLRGYTTPDLINALTTQTANDGQTSPGARVLEEMFPIHNNNNDNRPILPPTNPYNPVDRRNSQVSLGNRSVSSSMNDNESSNSTTPSSPTSTHRGKDELQYVPSMGTNPHEEPKDFVRKEKKRERNRQAAQKCRTRKLTRIAELQKRVNDLQGKNKDLTSIAECLQSDIVRLEKQLQDHHTQGCTLMNGSVL